MSKLRKWLMKEEEEVEAAAAGSPGSHADSAIKLFGKTIPVTGGGADADADTGIEVITDDPNCLLQKGPPCSQESRDAREEGDDAEEAGEETVQGTEENYTSMGLTGTADELGSSLGSNRPAEAEEEKSLKSCKRESDSTVTTTGTETVTVAAEDSEGRSHEHKEEEEEEEEEEGGQEVGSQGKNLKKPDKPAPCPRCESLDTKFCYYNNYNVNQPRHFCKNCQRYWTAGGTLRNVPVGAGRRKNKHVGLQARSHGATANGSVVTTVKADSREESAQQQLLPSCAGSRISPLKHPQIPRQCPTPSALNASSGGITITTLFCQDDGLPDGAAFSRHASGTVPPQPYPCRNAHVASGGEISLIEGFHMSGKVRQLPAMNGSQNGVSGAGERPTEEVEKKEVVDECATSSLPERVSTTAQEAANNNTAVPVPFHPSLQPDVGGLYRAMAVGDAGVLAAGGTGGPFGFYNGAWPYGFNVGWSGAVPAGSHGVVGSGQLLAGNGMATWNLPPNGIWTGAGVLPWASLLQGMPGSPWVVPPGWGGWTAPLPWAAAAAAAAQAAASTANGSGVLPSSRAPGITTPALGKHPRERPEGSRQVDGALWAPKSLRVDNAKEAARSSVWNALSMPNPPAAVVVSGSMFKAFQPKTKAKTTAEIQPHGVKKQSIAQQT